MAKAGKGVRTRQYNPLPDKIHGPEDWKRLIASRLLQRYDEWRRAGLTHDQALKQTLESSAAGAGSVSLFRSMLKRNPKADPETGLHIEYSPANMAYFVMWHNAILNVVNSKSEAREIVKDLTRKRNPGATNLAQYVQAALEHSRGSHDAGGKVIHETPKAKRREFAREIWFRRGYRNPRFSPEKTAAKLVRLHGSVRGAEIAALEEKRQRVGGVTTAAGRRAMQHVTAVIDSLGKMPQESVEKFYRKRGGYTKRGSMRNPVGYEIWKDATGRYYYEISEDVRSAKGIKHADARGTAPTRGMALSAIKKALKQNPGRPFIGPGGEVMTSGRRGIIHYRGFKIRRSGKSFFKILYPDGRTAGQRVMSEEAAYALIDAIVEKRVMTPAEHALVHPRRNPDGGAAADAAYKDFHGRGPDRRKQYDVALIDPYNAHPNLWQLGQLKSLTVGEFIEGFNGREGDQPHSKDSNAWAETIEFDNKAPDLAGEPGGRQLFIVGGDQNADRFISALRADPGKEIVDCGNVYRIEYFTRKGFDKFAPVNYWHHFGEETGVQPRLIYDRTNHRLQLAGGEYVVKREGIVN